MLVNSLQRNAYTADYYDFRVEQTGAGNEVIFFYDSTIPCRIYNKGDGRVFLYVTDTVLRIGARITNVRDRNGELVVGAYQNELGWTYDITSVDPVVNALGYRDALRYNLTRA
jgi:hypothetical protein